MSFEGKLPDYFSKDWVILLIFLDILG